MARPTGCPGRIVPRSIAAARGRGVGVVSVMHDPHHAHPVGDRFLPLGRGRSPGGVANGEVSVEELTRLVSGGAELEVSPATRSVCRRRKDAASPQGHPSG